MSINQVIIAGNIGQDIEYVSLGASGGEVAKFSVATTERWKDKASGEMREATEWHRVEVFGKTVNYVRAAMIKGTEVMLMGSIKTDKWQDQSGQTRYATKIVVRAPQHSVKVLSRGRPRDGAASNTQSSDQYTPAPADMDDEIPF